MPRFDLKDSHEIVSFSDRLEEFWQPRNDLMRAHQDLAELAPTVAYEEGHTRYTENTPATTVDLATYILSTNTPQHRIPYAYGPGDNAKQEARSAALERLFIGLWGGVDAQQRKRRRGRFNLELAMWAVLRGWVAGQVAWTGESPIPYQLRLWDPFHVYPDPDLPGLVVRRYRRSVASVLEEYPNLKKKLDTTSPINKDCDVIDLWYEKVHGVVVNGEWAKKPMEHGLDYPPIVVIPVGGYPVRSTASRLTAARSIVQLGDNSWVQHAGRSILYSMNDTQRYSNLLASQIADVFNFYANPIPVTSTEDGKPLDIHVGPGDAVGVKIGESFRFERPTGLPGDLAAWLGRVQQQIDRATFPGVMYGATPQEMSGFARSLVHTMGAMRVAGTVMAMQDFYVEADALILEQLEKLGAPLQIALRGQDYNGKTFKEVADLYDLKALVGGDYVVEVEVKPSLPEDLMGAVAMAGQLRQQRTWSRKTINEKLFPDLIQDAVGEEQRLTDEGLKDNPQAIALLARAFAPVSAIRKAREMLDSGRITDEEYGLVRTFIEGELRMERGAQARALAEVEAPPMVGMDQGPGGRPMDPGAFPSGAMPGQEQIPPEFLPPSMQGSPPPGPGGPPIPPGF